MKSYIAALFLILGLFGCETNTENSVEIRSFPEIIPLEGQPSNDITVMSRGNVNLSVIDTFLVIQKREEKFLQIYSINTHKFLLSMETQERT